MRALTNSLHEQPRPGTSEFGKLFEAFVVNEFVKMNEYTRSRFQFSHLRVRHQDEVDLILEKPGKETILIEIKSTNQIGPKHVRGLNKLHGTFENVKPYLLSQDKTARTIGETTCLHWQEGIAEIFDGSL